MIDVLDGMESRLGILTAVFEAAFPTTWINRENC